MSQTSKTVEPLADKAIKALMASVEGGSEFNSEWDAYNCRKLIRLFEPLQRKDTIAAGHTVKQQERLLCQALQTANKGQLKRFFNNAQSIVERILEDEAFRPQSSEGQDVEPYASKENMRAKECIAFLKCVVQCVHSVLEARIAERQQDSSNGNGNANNSKKPLKMLPQIADVAQAMHDILFTVHACGAPASALKIQVLNLCEAWWLANGERREAMIVQCLPLLVLRACEEEDCFTNKAHILRLYKLRDSFQCIDFCDQSSKYLRKLLLRVSSNPLCLKLSEGKKFLASLFQDVDLLKDLHLSFRAQLPAAKGVILQAYGEVYHRAWKDVREIPDHGNELDVQIVRETMEHEVLQDLMYAGIHVSSSKTCKAIFSVLEPFHADKKNKDVASMLYRLYNPIIWRSLTAANPRVRQNAVLLLEKVFPLYDPSSILGPSTMKEAVLKGTEALRIALSDEDPTVRIAASKAASSVCSVFWEALPPHIIRTLLNLIVMEHSSDKTSALVRASSVDAVTSLLGTTQSHGVLRPLLPSLGNLIHDKSEKVRLAVVKMLARIKIIPGIRFYHVVPVDHLMIRFVVEAEKHGSPCNSVTRELAGLLLNSYFPQGNGVSASEQLKRTISFLLTNPGASAVFYANVSDHLDIGSVVKFIQVLLGCLRSAVNVDQAAQIKQMQGSKKRQHHRSARTSRKVDETNDDLCTSEVSGPVSADDTSLMAALSNTIDVLWGSIGSSLEKETHQPNKIALEDFFFGDELSITAVLSHFQRKATESTVDSSNSRRLQSIQTCVSLLSCAIRLCPKAPKGMVTHLSTSLKEISKDFTEDDVQLFVSCLSYLCMSGHVDEVAISLASSLEKSFGDTDISLLSPELEESVPLRRSRRSMTKKVEEVLVPSLPSSIAWSVFDRVQQGVDFPSIKMRETILSSDPCTSRILEALKKGIHHAERVLKCSETSFLSGLELDDVECVIRACDVYGRFALHKYSTSLLKSNTEVILKQQIELLLRWTTKVVVPALIVGDQNGDVLQNLDISRISLSSNSLVHIPPGSPCLTSPPKQRPNRGRTPESIRGPSKTLNISVNDAPVTHIVATSLLLSSCLLSSEILAMGARCTEPIEEAALGWCVIFDNLESSLFQVLFPSFLRLAVQLKTKSGLPSLLQRLFLKCDSYISMNEDGISSIAKDALLSIIGCKHDEVESFILLFLHIVDGIISFRQQYQFPSHEVPETLSDLWGSSGSLAVFLGVIDSNLPAQICLARAIAPILASKNKDMSPATSFKAAIFRTLFKLLDRKVLADILEIQHSDDGTGGDVESFMQVLVEGVA